MKYNKQHHNEQPRNVEHHNDPRRKEGNQVHME